MRSRPRTRSSTQIGHTTNMSTDGYTIIGTGIALAIQNVGLSAWLRDDIRELRKGVHRLETKLRERIAKVEGLLEALR